MTAWVWFGAGVVLFAAEVLSGEFFLVMLGTGALSGAAAMALSDNTWVAVVVFAVVTLGLLVFARPALKRRFLHGTGMRTNTDALIGAKAMTLSTVDSEQGLVKLAGQEWTARSHIDGQVIESGRSVTVVEISGATAVVSAEPLIQ